MRPKVVDRVLGVVLAMFAVLCLGEAYRIWNGWDGTGTMALIVGGVFTILAVRFLVFPSAEHTAIEPPSRNEWFGMAAVGGPFALYLIVINWLGYVLSTWLLLAVVSKLIAPTRTAAILAWTGAVAIGTYILFKRYLMMYLPAGVLGI
jgi:hypothetical protein